jgi:hypothetical protein
MAAALATASATPSRAQDPKPAPPSPVPAQKPGEIPEAVLPPAALPRSELSRRLKILDGSLPDVLPPGSAVIVTPGRLDYGRTQLAVRGAEVVALTRHGAPYALFVGPHTTITGFRVEFDAAGPARYAVDVVVRVGSGAGPFEITVSGDGWSQAAEVTPDPDGHLLHLFRVPKAGRTTIRVDNSLGPSEAWFFFRMELLRVS